MAGKKTAAERTFVALDLDEIKSCLAWMKRLEGKVGGVKIGLQSFTLGGPHLIEKAKEHNLPVFLDLKLYDIPNTVEKAARAASQLGVFLFTVHVAGGEEMLRACARGVENASHHLNAKAKVLGVTVLTSEQTSIDEVLRRALLAKKCGCDGVVCSAQEVKVLRKELGESFLLVTPGIRMDEAASNPADDQKRVSSPKDALLNGSDYLVLGRPILQSQEPERVLKHLAQIIV